MKYLIIISFTLRALVIFNFFTQMDDSALSKALCALYIVCIFELAHLLQRWSFVHFKTTNER